LKKILFDNEGPVRRPLWDPRMGRMEETNNRALQLLDRLMDRAGVNIEAFKRWRIYVMRRRVSRCTFHPAFPRWIHDFHTIQSCYGLQFNWISLFKESNGKCRFSS
jgi:hypothetical protein